MDWSTCRDGRCPSNPHRQPFHFPTRRLLGRARQTMVEPLRRERHARIDRRAQPEPTAETGRRRHMVLQHCHGVTAVDAAGCLAASRLRAISLYLGYQHHRRIRCPRFHFVRSPLLSFHYRCRNRLRELSISNPCITPPPLSTTKTLVGCCFSVVDLCLRH